MDSSTALPDRRSDRMLVQECSGLSSYSPEKMSAAASQSSSITAGSLGRKSRLTSQVPMPPE